MSAGRTLTVALMVTAGILALSPAWAASLVVINGDGAGVGFNDPTPVSPAGGNPATTLGAARLTALQHAADVWGQKLASPVPVQIQANFKPLTCTPTSALMGMAGATTNHRDFPSAPKPGVWYVQALANSFAGVDLDPADPDINAAFNSTLDAGICLGGQKWYYGFDGQGPTGTVDFLTTALHELAHGLGFNTFVDLTTGARLLGFDDTFMLNLVQQGATPPGYPAMTDAERVLASESDPNLQWTGLQLDGAAPSILSAGISSGHVRMYGPATQAPGSSVNHFSTALSPHELMDPFFRGTNHDLRLTLKLLQDTGWQTASTAVPGLTVVARVALIFALTLVGGLAVTRRRRRAGYLMGK